jgi:acyl-CoA thioesterase FadM
MPGDSIAVYSRLVARSPKRLHYLMFLVNETKGKLAAIFECMNAFLDLSVRKAGPFPPGIIERIDAWLDRDRNLNWPPPVSGSMQA